MKLACELVTRAKYTVVPNAAVTVTFCKMSATRDADMMSLIAITR